ncbi:Notch-regulated ankyrin repeat-containing protein A [Bagarius yarrelli]|uniref:Notch-regulated ankyrin repeat-containing protein A n=1 Tax=Bagarius yarrelli TaxID=175774 RepID=A0A556VVR1_BAGYA|nr:Notch-regulated ankyrin repeat-containing protein A [Bagarius yarrelli]
MANDWRRDMRKEKVEEGECGEGEAPEGRSYPHCRWAPRSALDPLSSGQQGAEVQLETVPPGCWVHPSTHLPRVGKCLGGNPLRPCAAQFQSPNLRMTTPWPESRAPRHQGYDDPSKPEIYTIEPGGVSTCSAPQRVFQEAVRRGNTKELHTLLQNMSSCEFNVNSFGPEGQTALHQSVIDGNLELVKLLVKFGADIRLANREGWSALHIAAFGGHQDIVLFSSPRPSTPTERGDGSCN